MAAATEGPSRTRDAIDVSVTDRSGLARCSFESPQLVEMPQNNEVIAHPHHRVGRRIEFHATVAALDPYHDHSETLVEIGFQDGPARQSGTLPDLDLFHVQLDVLGAGCNLHEVDYRGPQRRLGELESADLIGRHY